MEINDILNKLGLDLSNPEAKRGALEAIDAILSSRAPISGADLDGGGSLGETETEVELDPDLLQPSIKQAPSGGDGDIEVEDEENILDQIKHKESEDPIDNTNSVGNDSKSDDSKSSEDSANDDDIANNNEQQKDSKSDNKDDDNAVNSDDSNENNNETNSTENEESGVNKEDSNVGTDDSSSTDDFGIDNDVDGDEEFDSEDSVDGEEDDTDAFGDTDDDSFKSDGGDFGDFDVDFDDEDTESENEENSDEDDEEFEFDEDDFLDDELKSSTEDETDKTKHNSRKIKRERTLAAAKKALADAQAKKASPALIRELEKSIEALEALTEAVSKSIKDISDEEFNLMINRVLDAIDACGNSGLTFTSDEERQARAQEIKADIAKAETQNELSAEDVAQIRAETQAIKAREKETAKYQTKSSGSFKGFQEFLNSLYKAIALQVDNEETRDDSWSAINRRYSGTGILQPGKKINDLPNRRIPIIDFYFDCSLSWTQDDIAVGKKAVAALADLEQKGQIKVNIYYFSDEVSQNYEDVAGDSTSAWNLIIKNIIATQATNVVIMTDGDMERQGKYKDGASDHLKYTIPGYVWYLWKNGENAPRLPRDLKGRGGVQQFSFSDSGV